MKLVLPTLIVAAAWLPAQGTAVFPSDHTNPGAGAPSVSGYSWARRHPLSNGISRTMYLYETWDLNVPDGAQIMRVGFPRDESRVSTGHALRLQVCIGRSQLDAATADREFARNYSAPATENFATKTFQLPDLGPTGVDEVYVPLDVPHTLDKTQNLVVEYRVYANSNGNQVFDYFLDFGQFMSPVTAFAPGCATSGGVTPVLTSRRTALGLTWHLDLSNAPASANVTLGMNLSRLPSSLRLPFTSCDLHLYPIAFVPGTTSTSGRHTWSFLTPDDISIYRSNLYSQVIAEDFFANPLGLVTSNGDQMQLGVEPRQTMIAATGDPLAQFGTVQRNYGQIALFDWQ